MNEYINNEIFKKIKNKLEKRNPLHAISIINDEKLDLTDIDVSNELSLLAFKYDSVTTLKHIFPDEVNIEALGGDRLLRLAIARRAQKCALHLLSYENVKQCATTNNNAALIQSIKQGLDNVVNALLNIDVVKDQLKQHDEKDSLKRDLLESVKLAVDNGDDEIAYSIYRIIPEAFNRETLRYIDSPASSLYGNLEAFPESNVTVLEEEFAEESTSLLDQLIVETPSSDMEQARNICTQLFDSEVGTQPLAQIMGYLPLMQAGARLEQSNTGNRVKPEEFATKCLKEYDTKLQNKLQ